MTFNGAGGGYLRDVVVGRRGSLLGRRLELEVPDLLYPS